MVVPCEAIHIDIRICILKTISLNFLQISIESRFEQYIDLSQIDYLIYASIEYFRIRRNAAIRLIENLLSK